MPGNPTFVLLYLAACIVVLLSFSKPQGLGFGAVYLLYGNYDESAPPWYTRFFQLVIFRVLPIGAAVSLVGYFQGNTVADIILAVISTIYLLFFLHSLILNKMSTPERLNKPLPSRPAPKEAPKQAPSAAPAADPAPPSEKPSAPTPLKKLIGRTQPPPPVHIAGSGGRHNSPPVRRTPPDRRPPPQRDAVPPMVTAAEAVSIPDADGSDLPVLEDEDDSSR